MWGSISVSRNISHSRKRDIFAGLVDKIRQRSHSWTTRFLNGAGKEVLLKAVLAALPAHTMSCFKFPLSLCKQIQSILTRFWWDLTPATRKMAWVSWNTLTLPKSAGGLGFREIEQFNDALLAKAAWRILKFPQSLLSRILLGKYCLSSTFLEAAHPSAGSHGWRGIIIGRDVLLKSLGWIVGSGSKISVWNDPWLSLNTPISPIGPPTLDNKNLKISDLIDPTTQSWDINAIRSHLPQCEDHIRQIIPSSFHMEDELVWLASKSGEYSTKSGYALLKIHTESPNLKFNWKACIRNVKTSPKLKHLLWKIKKTAPSQWARTYKQEELLGILDANGVDNRRLTSISFWNAAFRTVCGISYQSSTRHRPTISPPSLNSFSKTRGCYAYHHWDCLMLLCSLG